MKTSLIMPIMGRRAMLSQHGKGMHDYRETEICDLRGSITSEKPHYCVAKPNLGFDNNSTSATKNR